MTHLLLSLEGHKPKTCKTRRLRGRAEFRSRLIICRLSTLVRPSLPGEDSSMCTDSSSSEATQRRTISLNDRTQEADASVRSRIKPPERALQLQATWQTPTGTVLNAFFPSRTRTGRQPHELRRLCDRPERDLIPRSVHPYSKRPQDSQLLAAKMAFSFCPERLLQMDELADIPTLLYADRQSLGIVSETSERLEPEVRC